jgi:restriction endonuclease S subunit
MWVAANEVGERIDARYYQKEYVETLREIRDAGEVTHLGAIAPNMGNGPHGGIDYVSEDKGIPYIRAKDLDDFTVLMNDPVYISSDDHERHKRGEVVPGDILVTVTGAYIGKVSLVPDSIARANIIQSLGKLRIETTDDPGYIVAFLGSKHGQLLIQRESVNTAREGINFEYLSNVPVLLPAEEVQTAIGRKIQKAHRLRALLTETVAEITADVEELISGELDKDRLVQDGKAIVKWLDKNQLSKENE